MRKWFLSNQMDFCFSFIHWIIFLHLNLHLRLRESMIPDSIGFICAFSLESLFALKDEKEVFHGLFSNVFKTFM